MATSGFHCPAEPLAPFIIGLRTFRILQRLRCMGLVEDGFSNFRSAIVVLVQQELAQAQRRHKEEVSLQLI
jgi:hypothetical protein